MSVADFSSNLYAQTFSQSAKTQTQTVQPGLLDIFLPNYLGCSRYVPECKQLYGYTSTVVCFIPKYFVALSSPGNHDVYNLQAPSDEEKQNWIKYFQFVIKNLKSTDQTQILSFICTINFFGNNIHVCLAKFIAKHSQLASYCTMS